ncbi:GD19282 [Drosophila simulans]|uniref:GD19282 n=1 Tax=Drosophila simulans TaxID=7240 RepID=B4QTE9_DROSI|nr:GD19282 [Drosophila simulans]
MRWGMQHHRQQQQQPGQKQKARPSPSLAKVKVKRSAGLWACQRHISCSRRHHNANYERHKNETRIIIIIIVMIGLVQIPGQRLIFCQQCLPESQPKVAPPNPEMEPLAPCGAWLETAKTTALDGACSDH